MLEPGKYQTRNGRVVELKSSQTRTITLLDGSPATFEFWRGTYFKADGITPESDYEWVPSIQTRTLGEYVEPPTGRPSGRLGIMDLEKKIAA